MSMTFIAEWTNRHTDRHIQMDKQNKSQVCLTVLFSTSMLSRKIALLDAQKIAFQDDWERKRDCVRVCLCLRERERVCVYVCDRERE